MATETASLYEKTLQALTAADAGRVLKDKGKGGLMGKVSVSTKGIISVPFTYRYRSGTRTRDYGCGSWPADSLAVIRSTYDKAHERVRLGFDPIDERNAAKAKEKADQSKAAPLTVRGLFDKWKASELGKRQDKGAEPQRALTKDIFPALGKLPAADVTRAKYLALLDDIKNRPAPQIANNVLGFLSNMYAWGVDRDLVPANPLATTTRKKVGGAAGERDRTLSVEELKKLHGALDEAGLTDAVKHGLMVVLGTACRSGELLKARKAEISLEDRTWRIPPENSKNGKAHLIILSPWAAWHMGKLFEISGASPWLMPDPRKPLAHTHARLLINAVAERQRDHYERKVERLSPRYVNALTLGNEKWTPHDLRRTAATVMGELGTPSDVIDRCLNHIEVNKVKRTYQRQVMAEPQAEAWRALGEFLQGMMPIEQLVPAPAA